MKIHYYFLFNLIFFSISGVYGDFPNVGAGLKGPAPSETPNMPQKSSSSQQVYTSIPAQLQYTNTPGMTYSITPPAPQQALTYPTQNNSQFYGQPQQQRAPQMYPQTAQPQYTNAPGFTYPTQNNSQFYGQPQQQRAPQMYPQTAQPQAPPNQ